jgi:hypothetical protein
MEMRLKQIANNERDFSEELGKLISDRTNRSEMARLVKLAGIPADAPCWEMAYPLTDGGVYKVNCPGWIYVAYKDSTYETNGDNRVLLASSPNNLTIEANRLLYLQGDSGSVKNGTTMVPIYPGTDTYMYVKFTSSKKTIYFVPAAISVAMYIYEPSYAEFLFSLNINSPTGKMTSTGNMASIFNNGDATGWLSNFKSVAGVYVSNENKIDWAGHESDKTRLKTERKNWLLSLDVSDTAKWGYP